MEQEWIDWISRSCPKSQLAINLATKFHDDQLDNLGVPYIKYVRDVVHRVCSFGEDTIIVGLLHHSVKYEKISLDEIEEKFGSNVRIGVEHITQRVDEDYLGEFLPRAVKNQSSKSVAIAMSSTNLTKLQWCADKKVQNEMEKMHSTALRFLGISEGLIQAKDISFMRCPWFRGWLPRGGWQVEERTTKVIKSSQRSSVPSAQELYLRRPIEL